MTSTFTCYTVTPEYWRESVTATTPCKVDIIPQSFFDGLADVEADRVAPMWAVILPSWLVRLVWFRGSNQDYKSPSGAAHTAKEALLEYRRAKTKGKKKNQ